MGSSTIEKTQQQLRAELALLGYSPKEQKREIVVITHRTTKQLCWPSHFPTTFYVSVNGEPVATGGWRSTIWEIAYHKRRGAKIKGLRRLRH